VVRLTGEVIRQIFACDSQVHRNSDGRCALGYKNGYADILGLER